MEGKMFVLDHWTGKAVGGYFVRNDLKQFFEVLKTKGLKPVGIKFDGSFNLEIFVEKNDSSSDRA